VDASDYDEETEHMRIDDALENPKDREHES
jgi:hypothetical protein